MLRRPSPPRPIVSRGEIVWVLSIQRYTKIQHQSGKAETLWDFLQLPFNARAWSSWRKTTSSTDTGAAKRIAKVRERGDEGKL
jgi:hypothetical protein